MLNVILRDLRSGIIIAGNADIDLKELRLIITRKKDDKRLDNARKIRHPPYVR